MNKQFKKILFPVIVSTLYFFKIHRKMISGNPSIIAKNMFGKTPESLNAITVIFCSFIYHSLGVINSIMLSQSFQRIIAFKRIHIVYRSFSCFFFEESL